MLNRVSANEFIMLLKIFYYGRTVWGHSKMEKYFSWWLHQMDTFSALPALCERNTPVTGGFPSQRPVTQSFDVFFDLRLNKRLSKQSKRWWFETQSPSLLRNCKVDPDTVYKTSGRPFANATCQLYGRLLNGGNWSVLATAKEPSTKCLNRYIWR